MPVISIVQKLFSSYFFQRGLFIVNLIKICIDLDDALGDETFEEVVIEIQVIDGSKLIK